MKHLNCAHFRRTAVVRFPLLLAALAISSLHKRADAQTVPADAQSQCVVSPQVLASFFASGNVTANGVVNPADSLNFPNTPDCSFYQWAAQMFLWLTSPTPAT
jgi:hypothetical protein